VSVNVYVTGSRMMPETGCANDASSRALN
jgi:hypothetical protein